MNNNIILSILIPTYKRPAFLETAVNCCIKQIKSSNLENSVEILVGNNYSKDETKNYLALVTSQHQFIHGFNHSKNLGMSGNIEFLVKESVGTYILICGDDDLLGDGAIAYFVKSLKEKNPNFVLINTSNIISNDEANRDIKIIRENRLGIDRDIFVEDFQKNLSLLSSATDWVYMTNLLPAVISKKELFLREEATAKKYLSIMNREKVVQVLIDDSDVKITNIKNYISRKGNRRHNSSQSNCQPRFPRRD